MEHHASGAVPQESDLLYTKRVECTVCGQEFETRVVRSAKLRRIEPDLDLRPRYRYIDTLKYDVYSCPHCGYTATTRNFGNLTKGQVNLVKEQICSKFQSTNAPVPETIDYETAIRLYKLALISANAKRARISELAYACLKISWLYRSYREELPEGQETEKKQIGNLEEDFYHKAYEGFKKAIAEEDFPICGMDSLTMDYLMGCLAFHFKEYAYASKAVANILGSQIADRRTKDKALDLKTNIVAAMRQEKSGSDC